MIEDPARFKGQLSGFTEQMSKTVEEMENDAT